MNAVIQCLKSVPELRETLNNFKDSQCRIINVIIVLTENKTILFTGLTKYLCTGVNLQGGEISQSVVASVRDLLSGMDKGPAKHPIILLQMLHTAFPQFAERGNGGSFVQQVNRLVIYLFLKQSKFENLMLIEKNVRTN